MSETKQPKNSKSVKTSKNTKSVKTLKSNQKSEKTYKNKYTAHTDICDKIMSLRESHFKSFSESSFLETKKESKEAAEAFYSSIKLLKGVIFKFDQPYRTRIHNQSLVSTSSAGVVNLAVNVNSIASASEWTSLDAIFDEFFVHSVMIRWFPLNNLSKGIGQAASSGGIASVNAGGTNVLLIANAQLVMASLFNGAPTYSSATALSNNATKAYHNTGDVFKYSWRNNNKFEKRGLCIVVTNTQSWCTINNASNYGGQIQIRTVNDVVLGGLTAALNMATLDVEFDVSFRARS